MDDFAISAVVEIQLEFVVEVGEIRNIEESLAVANLGGASMRMLWDPVVGILEACTLDMSKESAANVICELNVFKFLARVAWRPSSFVSPAGAFALIEVSETHIDFEPQVFPKFILIVFSTTELETEITDTLTAPVVSKFPFRTAESENDSTAKLIALLMLAFVEVVTTDSALLWRPWLPLVFKELLDRQLVFAEPLHCTQERQLKLTGARALAHSVTLEDPVFGKLEATALLTLGEERSKVSCMVTVLRARKKVVDIGHFWPKQRPVFPVTLLDEIQAVATAKEPPNI